MKTSWIIWYVVILHVTWGLLLLFTSEPLHTTPLSMFERLIGGPVLISALLLSSSALATIGVFMEEKLEFSWTFFLIPQQTLLILSAQAVLIATLNGTYADGVVRTWPFIFADQVSCVAAAIAYSCSLGHHLIKNYFGKKIELP